MYKLSKLEENKDKRRSLILQFEERINHSKLKTGKFYNNFIY